MPKIMIFLFSLFLSVLVSGCLEGPAFDAGEVEEEKAVDGPADLEFVVTETVAIGANPHGMQKVGDTLYIAAAGDNFIELLDLKTMTITTRWPAPDVPLDLVKAKGGWLVSAFRGDYLHLWMKRATPLVKPGRLMADPVFLIPTKAEI